MTQRLLTEPTCLKTAFYLSRRAPGECWVLHPWTLGLMQPHSVNLAGRCPVLAFWTLVQKSDKVPACLQGRLPAMALGDRPVPGDHRSGYQLQQGPAPPAVAAAPPPAAGDEGRPKRRRLDSGWAAAGEAAPPPPPPPPLPQRIDGETARQAAAQAEKAFKRYSKWREPQVSCAGAGRQEGRRRGGAREGERGAPATQMSGHGFPALAALRRMPRWCWTSCCHG